MRDHEPLTISSFRGLFDRGRSEAVPQDHARSSQNNEFLMGGVKTRSGFDLSLTKANLRRIAIYKRTGEATRLLVLDNAGNLYDSLDLSTPILTVVGMTDFSMITISNRAYITPHDGVTGLAGQKVYVYQGSGTARPAGGNPPSGFTLGVATSGSSGSIEAGYHLFAVAYETDSGYITKGGPTAWTLYTAPGGFKADLSAIPVGPAGTVARHVLASKKIPTTGVNTYTGRQEDYELFFVPGGKISNNTATTVTVDFFDANLIDSADYLLDQLSEIPAGVTIGSFGTRMVVGGENLNPWYVRLSKGANPESFDSLAGFINAVPADGGVSNTFDYRGNIYILKASGSTYTTTDNNQDPNTWAGPFKLDLGIGAYPHSVGIILDRESVSSENVLVADKGGLWKFHGIFDEQPLTWKIQDIWDRINSAAMKTVEVKIDPIRKTLYVNVPLDGATSPNNILYGDWSEGLTPIDIKWECWKIPSDNPVSMVIDTSNTTGKTVFKYASYTGNIYLKNDASTNDFGNIIIAYYETFGTEFEEGGISHFAGVRGSIRGSGNLDVLFSSDDNAFTAFGQSLTLSSSPGREQLSKVNFNSQRAYVKFSVDTLNHKYEISRLTVFGKSLWEDVPA